MNFFDQHFQQVDHDNFFATPFSDLDSFAIGSVDEPSHNTSTEQESQAVEKPLDSNSTQDKATKEDKIEASQTTDADQVPVKTVKNRTPAKRGRKKKLSAKTKLSRDIEKRERDKERARKNRVRKKEYIFDLEKQIEQLKAENSMLREQLSFPFKNE